MYGYTFSLERIYTIRFINMEQKCTCCHGEGQIKSLPPICAIPYSPTAAMGLFSLDLAADWVKMWVCWQVIAANFPLPSYKQGQKKKKKVIIWLNNSSICDSRTSSANKVCYSNGERANIGKLSSAYIILFSSILVLLCFVY